MLRSFLPLLMASLILFPCAKAQQLAEAFPNLSFDHPLYILEAPDGSGRMFVLEQKGLIWVFPNNPDVKEAEVFLDIRDKLFSGSNEAGLLGMAFHPDYAENGWFYLNYTRGSAGNMETVIACFNDDPHSPGRGDADSGEDILTFGQPYGNHNAGQILFGQDGYLYIATGDGGAGGDPQGNGQDRGTLLGAMLRIDVDSKSEGRNYAIPPDNPYAGNRQGFREEIWAYGLRNPYRFSLDRQTGKLWLGDSGQDQREEIDIIEKGKNYGWNIMEGSLCYEPPEGCDKTGLTMPVFEYAHDETDICVIIGGYVYRGDAVPELQGKYIFADYCAGMIWALDADRRGNTASELLMDTDFFISSFGEDAEHELYVVLQRPGKIMKLEQS